MCTTPCVTGLNPQVNLFGIFVAVQVAVPNVLACAMQLFQLQTALRDANITIYGGERSCKYLSLPSAPSPRHEYGTAALTLELVESMDDAIDHLHANGSGHTECIVTGTVSLVT